MRDTKFSVHRSLVLATQATQEATQATQASQECRYRVVVVSVHEDEGPQALEAVLNREAAAGWLLVAVTAVRQRRELVFERGSP